MVKHCLHQMLNNMNIFIESFKEAFRLIFTFDSEIFEIVFLSLKVSFSSLLIASIIGIPCGIKLAKNHFKGKHLIVRIIYTLMGLPPVLCGLFVYILLMRKGPLGQFQLNYTVSAMILAQVLLITPIICGLTMNSTQQKQHQIVSLAKTLGANSKETFFVLFYELRFSILTAIITGFSRAISEVGAVMIVGGNIEGKTRVMTTYISQLKGMGQLSSALAVGIILLLISFLVNSILYHYQKEMNLYEY